MIELSAFTIQALFFFILTLIPLSLWIAAMINKGEKTTFLPSQEIRSCEFCLTPYPHDLTKKNSRCPTCHLLNDHK
jgi:hypothetical protein